MMLACAALMPDSVTSPPCLCGLVMSRCGGSTAECCACERRSGLFALNLNALWWPV